MLLQNIPDGQVYTICASNLEAFICGAYKAGFHTDGKIVVVYTDQSRETGIFSIEDSQVLLDKGEESIFPIVGAVQSQRRYK